MKNEYAVEGKLIALNQPSAITFHNNMDDGYKEVMRISKDGITANPDIPTDKAAQAILRALDSHIKALTQRTWVGLTDEEIAVVLTGDDSLGTRLDELTPSWIELVKAVEAKLKEKNT